MNTLAVTIVDIHREADDIVSITLKADAGTMPRYEPGAHIDVHLPGGLIRQYSLFDPYCASDVYRIAVLRDPASRGGSAAVHDTLKVGQHLLISPPRNQFELMPASRTLLLAGGIGITPILCMAQHLHETGRNFILHYFVRSRSRAAFARMLRESAWAGQVKLHFDDEPDTHISMEELFVRNDEDDRIFMCGPEGFLSHFQSMAQASGWAGERIHLERFSAQQPIAAGNGVFTVRLARSGAEVLVSEGETILAALLNAGIDVPSSCEQGFCGTCVTDVLEGIPDHQDTYLDDAEKAGNSKIILCCSRARTKELVLDL